MALRWFTFSVCAVLGLVLLMCGLLVPAHLRAVDAGVVAAAGGHSPGLLAQGQMLAGERKLGAAQMLMRAARLAGLPGWDLLGTAITNLARQNPAALAWGDDGRTEDLFGNPSPAADPNLPFTDLIIHRQNRDAALAHLQGSSVQAVQELMQTRSLQHTVLLPPSSSASGQAFDASVCICGLLLDGNRLPAGLSREVSELASQANRGADSEPLEQTLMDFLSLGERFNWDQLTAFVADIPDPGTLHRLTDDARAAGDNLPALFAAVQLSGRPAAVADYLAKFRDTGMSDLTAGLRYGAGGVGELVKSQRRLYDSRLERRVTGYDPFGAFYFGAAKIAFQKPWLATVGKWLLYLLAGFFLALALHFARPAVPALERPLQVRGIHLFREILFALGFLLVVLLLSEPFLAQETREGNVSLRLLPSTAGVAVPTGIAGIKQTIMDPQKFGNPVVWLTMLVFFVLQSLLYISCLVKLAEIRRQNLPPRMKLKLLENEDHLFDSGLYLGFVGTIVSLILFSLQYVQFSLMAAYSSTSFGIVFVVIFKIFHLRPARRKLLLEAEARRDPRRCRACRARARIIMNRSILIVICDFLLLSLLTFSTDINHMADENTRTPTKIVAATNNAPNPGNDLAAAMKLALAEERRNAEQLQQQLTSARTAAGQQQTQLTARLTAREQENLRLQQQFAAAQTNLENLNQQLQTSTARSAQAQQKLAEAEVDAQKTSNLAARPAPPARRAFPEQPACAGAEREAGESTAGRGSAGKGRERESRDPAAGGTNCAR